MRVFLDDERDPPDDGNEWIVCRSFSEFFDHVLENGIPEFISFDHDLGHTELDGLVCAKELVELYMTDQVDWPDKFEWCVHSQNPIGKENINGYLKSWTEFKKRHDC